MGEAGRRGQHAHMTLESETWVDDPEHFHGRHASSVLPGLTMMRCETMEVTNDPRIFLENVLTKRFMAFGTIITASILLGAVSCSTLLTMQDLKETPTEYVALILMVFAFLMNLFCVLVLTMQYYSVFRLMTAGPTGFEVAKSYYLNVNIKTMRHLGTAAFFYSIPIFVWSIACMVYNKLGGRYGKKQYMSIPLTDFLLLSGLVLWRALRKQSNVFFEKYTQTKEHEAPLRSHVLHTSGKDFGSIADM